MNLYGNPAHGYKGRAVATRRVNQRQRPAAERARIREVFLRPQREYALAEVAALLRVPESEVVRRIEDGSIAAVRRGGRRLILRQEMIGVLMAERWTPRLVAEALPARAVPHLARSVAGTVELPGYAWRCSGRWRGSCPRRRTGSSR